MCFVLPRFVFARYCSSGSAMAQLHTRGISRGISEGIPLFGSLLELTGRDDVDLANRLEKMENAFGSQRSILGSRQGSRANKVKLIELKLRGLITVPPRDPA